MISSSFLWASVPLLSLQVAARGLVHQAEAREAAPQEAFGGLFQRLSPFKKREFCVEDAWYTAVSTHAAGESYCADLLSKTHETSVVYVTPTTTVVLTTGTRTFVKTQTARVTSTVSITTTIPASPMMQKRGPEPTAAAKLKRQAPPASVANVILSAFEAGSTIAPVNQYAQPSLTSACDCVYPGAAITDTVTSTDYVLTSTLPGFEQILTTTTSTSVIRTVTTTVTVSASGALNPSKGYYGGGGAIRSSTSSSASSSSPSTSSSMSLVSSSISSMTSSVSSTSSSTSFMSSAEPPPPHYNHNPNPVTSSSSSISTNSSSSMPSSTPSTSFSISYNGSFTAPPPYPSSYSAKNMTSTMNSSTTSIPIYTSWDGEFYNATTSSPSPTSTPAPITNSSSSMMMNMTSSSSISTNYNDTFTISSMSTNTTSTPCTTSTGISTSIDGYFVNATTSRMPSNTTSIPYPTSTDNCTTTSISMSSSYSIPMNSTTGCSATTTFTTTETMYSATFTKYITVGLGTNGTMSTSADGEIVTPIPDSVSASSSTNSTSSSPPTTSLSPPITISDPVTVSETDTTTTTSTTTTSFSTILDTFLAPVSTILDTLPIPTITGCINLGNQIKNGDFEIAIPPINDPANFYFVTDDEPNINFSDNLDSAQHSIVGLRSGRFNAATDTSGTLYQDLTLCPNATYELSGYIRTMHWADICTAIFSIGDQVLYSATSQMLHAQGADGVWAPLGAEKKNFIAGMERNVTFGVEFYCDATPDPNLGFMTFDVDDLSLTQVTG